MEFSHKLETCQSWTWRTTD